MIKPKRLKRNPFNCHFSRTINPAPARLNESDLRDDGVAVASTGPYANHLHLVGDEHASTSSLNFYIPDALPDAKPTASQLH